MKITRRQFLQISTSIVATPSVLLASPDVDPIADVKDVNKVWGNNKSKPTALDRANVRRLLFYIENVIRAEFQNAFFMNARGDLEIDTTYDFVGQSTKIMESIRERSGVQCFTVEKTVESDGFTNVKVSLQPIKSCSWITICFFVHVK